MSLGKITLTNPIKINGQAANELTYDTDLITVEDFLEAEGYKTKKIKGVNASVAEVDSALAVSLGMRAILATNKEIDIMDLERLHGVDVMQLLKIGRSFTSAAAVGPSQEKGLEKPSATTAAPITPVPEK